MIKQKTHYLVVGRAGMDLAPEPAGTGIDEAMQFSASLGGSAANIAAGLARLHGKVSLFSCLSQDPVGDYCLKELQKYGVACDYVFRSGGQTRSSLALSEARVGNHRTVIYRNQAADFEITPAQAEAIDLSNISHIIITGTALALEPSREAVLALLARAKAAQIEAVLDIDYRPYSWASGQDAAETLNKAAQYCQLIAGNEDEFDVLAGSKDAGLAYAQKFAADRQAICIYKRGQNGATSFDGAEVIETSIFPAKPLKPTGAGDSFMAALLVARDEGFSLYDAIMRGSAAAAMVVSRPACAPAMPTAQEIEQFMASNSPIQR